MIASAGHYAKVVVFKKKKTLELRPGREVNNHITPRKMADARSSNPSFYKPLLNVTKEYVHFSVRKILLFGNLKSILGNIFFKSGVVVTGVC